MIEQLCQPHPVITSNPSDLDPFRVFKSGDAARTVRSERYADRSEDQIFETYRTTSCSNFFLVAADFLPSVSVILGLIRCRVISSPALSVTKED